MEQFSNSRSLEKNSDNLFEILQHRAKPLCTYITCFNQEKVAISESNAATAISSFKHAPQRRPLQGVDKIPVQDHGRCMSRAWAQVKWEEEVASRAKAQQKQDQKLAKQPKSDRDEGSHLKPAREKGNKSRGRY
ncbi:hypothetical protein F2Q69_00059469 [Brassica cretica]|uniref:Retrotransposon gag domain-containing protein n=1 Tax=Brassica cretica TaxID=69181 RepID=A0A8S9RR49_BRACR|nr:hypothetical protein F2Q69_00059469 [Brassica cretica]